MKQKMKNWEYLIIDNADNSKLNELGINGWELVSVIYFPPSLPSKLPISTLPLTTFYFKKQIMVRI